MDELERRILRLLAPSATLTLTDIANQLRLDSTQEAKVATLRLAEKNLVWAFVAGRRCAYGLTELGLAEQERYAGESPG